MKLYRNRSGVGVGAAPYAGDNRQYWRLYPLTVSAGWWIVRHKYIYTYARRYTSHQTPGAPGLRHLQSPPWAGASCPVPGLGLLRSPGSAPAQVRELAGSAEG